MINKKLITAIFLVCFSVFHSYSEKVTMVYPQSSDRFVFETEATHNNKRIRFVVNKPDVGGTENFRRMFVTVLQAQATGFNLWCGDKDQYTKNYPIHGTHDGRPMNICKGLSLNK